MNYYSTALTLFCQGVLITLVGYLCIYITLKMSRVRLEMTEKAREELGDKK